MPAVHLRVHTLMALQPQHRLQEARPSPAASAVLPLAAAASSAGAVAVVGGGRSGFRGRRLGAVQGHHLLDTTKPGFG